MSDCWDYIPHKSNFLTHAMPPATAVKAHKYLVARTEPCCKNPLSENYWNSAGFQAHSFRWGLLTDHNDMIERDDEDGNAIVKYQYTYDDDGRKMSEESYVVSDGEQYLNYSTTYTYDDTHELPITEVITNDNGVQTTTRDFDTMAANDLYVETISEDGADDIVYHKRMSDNQTVYYNGQGSEITTEYDEHGNITKQAGKDATMGNFEQTFENTYDSNGNLQSVKTTYNGDEGYSIEYTYATLGDASYDNEGTLLFDEMVDTPAN